jgi:hypothetical protein
MPGSLFTAMTPVSCVCRPTNGVSESQASSQSRQVSVGYRNSNACETSQDIANILSRIDPRTAGRHPLTRKPGTNPDATFNIRPLIKK